jgi:hypothetical protein
MIDFPKGSKNEAILNQFNSLDGKEQIKMLIDAHKITSDLAIALKKNGFEKIKIVKSKDSSDLEQFKAEIATISNLKNQAKDNKIDVSRVSGVEKYGNEKVKQQYESKDIMNLKPGQTPNPVKSSPMGYQK